MLIIIDQVICVISDICVIVHVVKNTRKNVNNVDNYRPVTIISVSGDIGVLSFLLL
jgi:hypothetical protein